MKLLNKYHKQGFPKEVREDLLKLNKKYNLKYKDSLHSMISLMVFRQGLKNKNRFEKTFEAFRNSHLDMWDNLEFNERNLLLKHVLDPLKERMLQFQYDESTIYIPFFDVLMNNLYERETAILELPQFFKLYDDFQSSIIDMRLYGNAPIIHNMSDMEFIEKSDHNVIVFYERNNTFYCVNNDSVTSYPFYLQASFSQDMKHEFSKLILEGNEESLVDKASRYKVLDPKLIKKINRRKK